MLEIFIRRPILSTVISILITFLGLLSLTRLPITQFPDIVPPAVSITATYTGANAEVSAKAVATTIERAVNGVPGMTYMSTVCSNDGNTLIQIVFEVGTDPDLAAVNVQNRVTTALDELPDEVVRAGVVTEKEVNSILLYLNLISSDPSHDEKFVYNFADINIIKELRRINGVGFAMIMGSHDYSMRVWLKPDRMAAYNISTKDVVEAIQSHNVEAAPGKAGLSSDREAQPLQYVLRYTGKFQEPKEYGEIAIRSLDDGSILRVSDVADVEFGAMEYDMVSTTDGRPSASIMLKQRPGSNAQEVIEEVKAKMEELKTSSFPPGMEYNIAYDVSRFLDASIHEVLRTLFEAFILVFIIVYIFLQDLRSTIIPLIAVPVSLIGTLFFMEQLGFSINLLTLFALVLAIGIVVDNAIVVVEAVHVKMHEEHLPPLEATISAMKDIGGAIIAITLVMTAVFVPVGLMTGPVGIFYKQFSLTLAVAILISSVNALTLSPALCAIILKPIDHSANRKKNLADKFFDVFNTGYDKLVGKYKTSLQAIAGRRLLTISILIIFFLGIWGVGSVLPTGFIPTEDQGMIYVNVSAPPGATVERTQAVLDEVQRHVATLKETESFSALGGYSLITESAGSSYGMGMINLVPWDERDASVDEIITVLQEKVSSIHDAEIQFVPPPPVPGFGNASGFELRLQDRTGATLVETAEMASKFITALNDRPEIENTFSNFNASFPQYLIRVDYDKAAKLGITTADAMDALQTFIGSFYASNFVRFEQMYRVMVQASPEYRRKPEDLLKLFAKSDTGEMVPYSNFVSIERVFGPEQLTRYNMFTAVLITGEPAEGYSSGDAIRAVEETAATLLPRGYIYDWSGITREEIESGNQSLYIFAVCLLFVYLLLAAQYESYLLPLPVVLSLPGGIFGAFFFLQILGMENNIYAQVALIMLVGLLGKNAILIVEFAIQSRKLGKGILESAIDGAVARLRPILMTSLAFIAGLIPLCIATGAGAIGNRSIGTAAAGGMLIGTVFGVLMVPGLYVIFEGLGTTLKNKKSKTDLALNERSSAI